MGWSQPADGIRLVKGKVLVKMQIMNDWSLGTRGSGPPDSPYLGLSVTVTKLTVLSASTELTPILGILTASHAWL